MKINSTLFGAYITCYKSAILLPVILGFSALGIPGPSALGELRLSALGMLGSAALSDLYLSAQATNSLISPP
jgi:hypothetical protein